MATVHDKEPEALHTLRNHLAVVVSFAGLLLEEFDDADPRRDDVLEIHKAALAAMRVLPHVAALAQAGSKAN
jgi:hypothetical protein